MKIYIASSWKHEHGVQTELLRTRGHQVISWIENNYGEGFAYSQVKSFEDWIQTEGADKAFKFDTNGAMTSDLIIYYGNAGKDACAETGMAFAKGIPIIGLYQKGEDLGLMRKMMKKWRSSITGIMEEVELLNL